MNVKEVKPTPERLLYLANNLREIDREEALAMSPLSDIHATICDSFEDSWLSGVVEVDDLPVLGWGAAPVGRGYWGLWMLGTDELSKYKKTLLKESRVFVGDILKATQARALVNMTLQKNILHRRWLQALGADFAAPGPYGKNGEMFVPFMIKKKE